MASSSFPTSLISEKIFVRILVYASKICHVMPPMHLWLMHQLVVNSSSYPSMCIDEWCPTASTLPPQPSQQKISGVRSQLCSKRSSKGKSSENFLATDGFFEHNTYHVTALGCLKKMNNSDFRPFQVSQLRISFRYYHCYCILGQPI